MSDAPTGNRYVAEEGSLIQQSPTGVARRVGRVIVGHVVRAGEAFGWLFLDEWYRHHGETFGVLQILDPRTLDLAFHVTFDPDGRRGIDPTTRTLLVSRPASAWLGPERWEAWEMTGWTKLADGPKPGPDFVGLNEIVRSTWRE